jgi:hypothetical protein
MDRERIIEEIQDINANQRNNIYELAILDNKELLERLKELRKTKYPTEKEWNYTYEEWYENELTKLNKLKTKN